MRHTKRDDELATPSNGMRRNHRVTRIPLVLIDARARSRGYSARASRSLHRRCAGGREWVQFSQISPQRYLRCLCESRS